MKVKIGDYVQYTSGAVYLVETWSLDQIQKSFDTKKCKIVRIVPVPPPESITVYIPLYKNHGGLYAGYPQPSHPGAAAPHLVGCTKVTLTEGEGKWSCEEEHEDGIKG